MALRAVNYFDFIEQKYRRERAEREAREAALLAKIREAGAKRPSASTSEPNPEPRGSRLGHK